MINKILSGLIVVIFFLYNSPLICLEKKEDLVDIKRIERYLNDITTLKSSFIQLSSNGERLDGDIFISRPGRLRVQYEHSSPVLLVANGSLLTYVDWELEEISYIPITETPLRALIAPRIELDRFFKLGELERGLGTLSITLYNSEDESAGFFKMLFADKPLQLKQWFLKDTTGTSIKISLLDVERDVELNDDLFIVDPFLFEKNKDR
tara:strand:+ start:515 stop:1138 length:624 start_codon:yes stop_codon:yes gene_type:complete